MFEYCVGLFAACLKGFWRLLSGVLTTLLDGYPAQKTRRVLGRTRTWWRVVPVRVNMPGTRVVNERVAALPEYIKRSQLPGMRDLRKHARLSKIFVIIVACAALVYRTRHGPAFEAHTPIRQTIPEVCAANAGPCRDGPNKIRSGD